MIEVRNVSKQVVTTEGTLRILDQINLSVADGETIAIVGPSGFREVDIVGYIGGVRPSQ